MGKRERQREKKRKTQIQNRRGSKAFPQRPNRDEANRAPGDERTGARGFPKGPAGKTHNKQARGPLSGGKEAEKISQLYHGGQELLVLGDGDFSFSAGLAKRLGRGGCGGLVATSFDTAEEVANKYGKKAQSCLQQLQHLGATVAHKVDATKLSSTLPKERRRAFDAVVFNFPHTGTQQVHLNRQLLRLFFAGVQRHLKSNGEVHVTIKTVPPYSRWDVPAQAEASGLHLARKAPFRFTDFPGYHHRTTEKDAMTFDAFEKRCVTFVFVAAPGKQGGKAVPSGGPSRNAGNAESDDASDQDEGGSEGGSSEDGSDSDVGHGDVTGPGFEEEELDGDDHDDDNNADDDDGEEEEKDPWIAAPAGKPKLKRGREASGGEGNLKQQNKAKKSRKGNKRLEAGDVHDNTALSREEEDKEGKGEETEAPKTAAVAGGGGNERPASAPRLPRNKKLRLMMLRKERMDAMVRSEVDRFASSSAPGSEGHREGAGAGASGASKEESNRHAGSLSSVAKDEGKKNSAKAEAGTSSGPRKAGPGKKGKNKLGRDGAREA